MELVGWLQLTNILAMKTNVCDKTAQAQLERELVEGPACKHPSFAAMHSGVRLPPMSPAASRLAPNSASKTMPWTRGLHSSTSQLNLSYFGQ